jgi:hypothetical protein
MRTHPKPISLGQKPLLKRVSGKCLNQYPGVSIRKFEFPDGNHLVFSNAGTGAFRRMSFRHRIFLTAVEKIQENPYRLPAIF